MPDATDRSRRVLAALVREYITSGEPVASSLLVTAAGLGVSSATVRSILARLEEEGFVQQPHTSAGRIPTDRGYRFLRGFVARIQAPGRAATAVEARLRRDSPDRLIDSLLPQVSHVLSQASRSIGFAIRPAHEDAVFDRVEFVPLGATRVLVVIVASGGHVIQKVIDVGEPLEADDLHQAANYLNAEFTGLAAASCARGGARSDPRGAAAVRRAARQGDAAGDVGIRGPARRPDDLRRGRFVAARRCDRA